MLLSEYLCEMTLMQFSIEVMKYQYERNHVYKSCISIMYINHSKIFFQTKNKQNEILVFKYEMCALKRYLWVRHHPQYNFLIEKL